MKIFIGKLTIFVATLVAFLLLLQKVADSGLAKSPLCKEWSDLYRSRINADLLVQGSSRAWVHISPRTLDTALRLNSYNLGIDGHNFLMQYYRFKIYCKHNKNPKYIIQTVDPVTLNRRSDLYALEQFLPYLDDPLMKEAVAHYEGFEDVDYVIPYLKYRHTKSALLTGVKQYLLPSPSCKYKGFQAQDKRWDDSFARYKAKNPQGVTSNVDSLTNRLFDDFLSYCKANDIKVILVYVPEFVEAQRLIRNRAEIVGIFRQYATKYNLTFLDYSDCYLSRDKRYFYNSQHLNATGVARFNDILVSDLASIIGPHPL